MRHFTPDELIDAAEGILDAARLAHLDACERCRRERDALVDTLRAAASVPVPEPSPLFWDHFSARVRRAVTAEALARQGPWANWRRWPTLVPLAGLAVVVIGIVASLSGNVASPPGAPAEDRRSIDLSAESDVTTDAEWRALAELVGPLDWDTAMEAGLVTRPGAADLAMLDLSSDERQELSRLIASELAPPES